MDWNNVRLKCKRKIKHLKMTSILCVVRVHVNGSNTGQSILLFLFSFLCILLNLWKRNKKSHFKLFAGNWKTSRSVFGIETKETVNDHCFKLKLTLDCVASRTYWRKAFFVHFELFSILFFQLAGMVSHFKKKCANFKINYYFGVIKTMCGVAMIVIIEHAIYWTARN